MSEFEDTEHALSEFMSVEKSNYEDIQHHLDTVYDNMGLGVTSHLYGLVSRESQFDDLYRAYKDFYRWKDRRDTSRKQDKRENLMEAYRNYFGPGSNETWNKGVETAMSASFLMESQQGPVSKQQMRDILTGASD